MNSDADAAEGDTSVLQARSERFQQQFFKTQLCQLYKRGRCHRNDLCKYAHGEEELRQAPNLCKTALCPDGSNCKDEACRFAHHKRELRATNEFLNKDPCRYFIRTGRCALGKKCRYSHSLDSCVPGQEDQEEGFQASPRAGPTQDLQEHIECVRRPSEPRKAGSFQGRRAFYAGGPARSMSIPADSEAPQALRLPPAPPLPEDTLPPLTSVRQMHHITEAESNLLKASLVFLDANTALGNNNDLDLYTTGPPRPSQVFPQGCLPKDTRCATGIPMGAVFHKNADSTLGNFAYAQEHTLQISGPSAAAPKASFEPDVRTETNRQQRMLQYLSRSVTSSKDSMADYHSCATALRSGQLPDSIGTFRGLAKMSGGLPEPHLEQESIFGSIMETGLPSRPYASEDAATVRGSSSLQHSHHGVSTDSFPTSEPFQSSVGALPAAAAATTPEGIGVVTSFWL